MVLLIKQLRMRKKAKKPGYFIVEKFQGITEKNLNEANLPFNPYSEINPTQQRKSNKPSIRDYILRKFPQNEYKQWYVHTLGSDRVPLKILFKAKL